MKIDFKSFTVGMLVMYIISAATFAFADDGAVIKAYFGKVKLVVNDVELNRQTLLFDGTTYVPIRAAAESLGMEVLWDGKNSIAYIDHSGKSRELSNPVSATNTSIESPSKQVSNSNEENANESMNYARFNNVPDFGNFSGMNLVNHENTDSGNMLESKYTYSGGGEHTNEIIKDYGKILIEMVLFQQQ
ncbi:copper amine oxidase N-terminal domain-containing protein, partial [Tyzzerella sp. OttesenSCG-928-J15]|nr:copper amine oxidase N-terminal domain-containing protein [Tyzzerella sp. OttesenSCG-928-J15]